MQTQAGKAIQIQNQTGSIFASMGVVAPELKLADLRSQERSQLEEIGQTIHIQQNREDFMIFDADDL